MVRSSPNFEGSLGWSLPTRWVIASAHTHHEVEKPSENEEAASETMKNTKFFPALMNFVEEWSRGCPELVRSGCSTNTSFSAHETFEFCSILFSFVQFSILNKATPWSLSHGDAGDGGRVSELFCLVGTPNRCNEASRGRMINYPRDLSAFKNFN